MLLLLAGMLRGLQLQQQRVLLLMRLPLLLLLLLLLLQVGLLLCVVGPGPDLPQGETSSLGRWQPGPQAASTP